MQELRYNLGILSNFASKGGGGRGAVVALFLVVGSLLSNQNARMSKNTTRIFIPYERSNSTQDFTTSARLACNLTTLDLRQPRINTASA